MTMLLTKVTKNLTWRFEIIISAFTFLPLFLFFLLVQGSILDSYVRTEGAWLLNPKKQIYKTNTKEECAEQCETETKFTCR